jgi:hypothetical protein
MMNEETPVSAEQSIETQTGAPEQSLTSTPEDAILNREKAAFDAYVRNQGMSVPENFKDAGAWFESLKNAQKEYTKSRQEVADLKKKYEQNPSTANPVKEEPAKEVAKEPVPDLPEVLKIPENKEPETPKVEAKPVTEEDWKQWTVEFATKNDLSPETLDTIKQKTGLPDYVINEYMQGQKAKLEMAYSKASELVGGREELNKLFVWASKNLTKAEQASINNNLSSPAWDVALYGLQAKYAKATQTSKPNEPKPTAKGQVPIASTQQGLTNYTTKREFYAERNDPRFNTDPKFRQYVEQRMMRTDFTKLPI